MLVLELEDYGLDDFDYIVKYNEFSKRNWKRRVELNKDPYFAEIYSRKYPVNFKDSKIRQRDTKDEEFEDDDEPEDIEDNNEEDIMVEEETELRATTIKELEKGDIIQQQADLMKKNVLEEALDKEINDELKHENVTRSFSVNLYESCYILILIIFVINRF